VPTILKNTEEIILLEIAPMLTAVLFAINQVIIPKLVRKLDVAVFAMEKVMMLEIAQ